MKNVIFITTDQQWAEAIGIDDVSYLTPNLDELVRRGVQFTQHICTGAQCTPARATWMTGKYPHEVGVNQIGHMLDPQDDNIAYAFNRHKYETVYFGKWHLGGKPIDYGFQVTEYRSELTDLWGANERPNYHSHMDAVSTAQALNYLGDYQRDKPFFMHLSWYMPHPNNPEMKRKGPFEDITAFNEEFPAEYMPVPSSYYQDDLSSKPAHQRKRSLSGESKITEAMVKEDARRYRKLLKLMDRNLGKIIGKLEEMGMLSDTMIVFTSDHGDMQGAHRLRLKGVVPYKELFNVPLIIWAPWLEPARSKIKDLNSSASLPNTLLEAVGLPSCDAFYPSLLPLFKQEETNDDAFMFIEHFKAYWGEHPFRGIQTVKYKYVFYYKDDTEEMYDLEKDPDEMVNIAGNPEYEGVRAEVRKQVDQWWIATGALSKEPIIDPQLNALWVGTKDQ